MGFIALFIPVHYTPRGEPAPEIKDGMFFSKDPRFFTTEADPAILAPMFEGTGIEVALLKSSARVSKRSPTADRVRKNPKYGQVAQK